MPKENQPIQYDSLVTGQAGDSAVSQGSPFTAGSDTLLEDMRLQQTIDSRYATNQALNSLRVSIERKLVLQAQITSVDMIDDTACLLCYLADIEIRIPFKVAFPQYPAELLKQGPRESLEGLHARQKQFLSKYIGAEISFLAVDVKPDGAGGYYAMANRVLALQAILRRNFLERSGPRYAVGQVVMADILSVSTGSLYINVLGLDLRLLLRHVSIRYIPNPTAVYNPGDKLPVKIMSLDISATTISMEVSGLQAEVEICKPNLRKVRIGSRYKATVTSNATIRRDGHLMVTTFLYLEGVNLPAFANVNFANTALHPGDSVYFEASGVTDSGYVHGSIIRYINHR